MSGSDTCRTVCTDRRTSVSIPDGKLCRYTHNNAATTAVPHNDPWLAMMSATTSSQSQKSDQSRPRLQKYLASAGIGSRRHCEEYILAGRVSVDGQVIRRLGTTVDPACQKVCFDDELVKPQAKRYYLLNKPPGYVCTHRDPSGRPRAVDLVPSEERRLFTVGRLDENSQGLLLVTNDGGLAQRLAHPRYRVPRKYRVQVVGKPTPDMISKLHRGIFFSDGMFRARSVRKIRSKGNSTFLEIELIQGRNRELRRMLAHLGHKVIHLERITFGPLKLGRLPIGRCRALRAVELKALRELVDERLTRKQSSSPKLDRRSGSTGPVVKPSRRRRRNGGKLEARKRQQQHGRRRPGVSP